MAVEVVRLGFPSGSPRERRCPAVDGVEILQVVVGQYELDPGLLVVTHQPERGIESIERRYVVVDRFPAGTNVVALGETGLEFAYVPDSFRVKTVLADRFDRDDVVLDCLASKRTVDVRSERLEGRTDGIDKDGTVGSTITSSMSKMTAS
ncbi:MAG: hypothetical protein ABEI98_03825 [Halorhabdus sp.]